MFGVLVDVSVSMKKAVTANYDIRSGLTDENVKRFHRIVTSLNKIVTDIVTTYDRKDLIFVSAFGLNASKCEGTDTCDFVSTLENVTRLQEINERRTTSEKQYLHDGHKILIEFAKRKNAPHAEPWIKDKLWPREAGILWEALKDDDLLAEKFLGLIPHESLGTHSFVIRSLLLFSRFYASALALQKIKNAVDSHKASTLARDTIKKTICEETELVNTLQKIQKPKPRLAKDVLSILNTILQGNKESSSSRVCKAIDSVSSYIFGETSMVTALKEAKEIFDSNADINQKVLFVLSGGVATDGNPIDIAQELKSSNVTIVTCYLTSDSIPEPEGLVDTEDPSWCKCARDLYHMSSAMPNTSIPITYLIDYGWKLPLSGESRLFVQANSLDVADKLCKVAVSQLMPNTDPLIDLLGKVSLATYIKQSNDDFQAQQQIGATCYANAIAAVFHLAMRRICNREGGIPEFETIRDRITQAFGKEAANTEAVIEKVHKEYRLEYCKVDEKGARQAINERRPVIARFSWKGNQEEMFKRFYKRFPTEILKASDIAVEGSSQIVGGHAVVLIRCHPNCLVFINSWGEDFADKGYFQVENEKVLHKMQFFDVYWKDEDLKPSERRAFKRKGVDVWNETIKTFKSIQKLPYVCPHCKVESTVDEYAGYYLEAQCPKCLQTFKPDGTGISDSLYRASCPH